MAYMTFPNIIFHSVRFYGRCSKIEYHNNKRKVNKQKLSAKEWNASNLQGSAIKPRRTSTRTAIHASGENVTDIYPLENSNIRNGCVEEVSVLHDFV